MNHNYFLIKIKIFNEEIKRFSLYLNDNISWGWEECGDQTFKIYFSSKTEQENFLRKILGEFNVIDIQVKEVEGSNWAREWKKYFTPITIGKFHVVPSWFKDIKGTDRDIPIFIYPEMAFGTGHHPTTKLCLLAIQRLYNEGVISKKTSFLDVGTGSGILGIGASLMGMRGIGLDVDPVILRNCKKNISLNKVGDRFFPFIGTISNIKDNVSFDLIMANILLEPLIVLKREIYHHLKPSGFLIVSGILTNQESVLINSYRDLFFQPLGILREGEWSAIIWKKA